VRESRMESLAMMVSRSAWETGFSFLGAIVVAVPPSIALNFLNNTEERAPNVLNFHLT
jgi:hypothetical protein